MDKKSLIIIGSVVLIGGVIFFLNSFGKDEEAGYQQNFI